LWRFRDIFRHFGNRRGSWDGGNYCGTVVFLCGNSCWRCGRGDGDGCFRCGRRWRWWRDVSVFLFNRLGRDLVDGAGVALHGIIHRVQLFDHVLVRKATPLCQLVYANTHYAFGSPSAGWAASRRSCSALAACCAAAAFSAPKISVKSFKSAASNPSSEWKPPLTKPSAVSLSIPWIVITSCIARATFSSKPSSAVSSFSISIFQLVSLAVKRAFWPFLPIARESWSGSTIILTEWRASSMTRFRSLAGASALLTY